ncbi:MAG: metal-dependent hydrolase [Candidatus Dactylopiibacterium sp.]|nr:metal-dependent hydrolase [Candidatus Dactylopiibacterium sp.]
MDSLTQIALGAAVGLAVRGRRTAPWKAALTGAVLGTLPDLDAFVDHGDPIRNMTFHRTESHALFYLTLLAPALAWLVARLWREAEDFRAWWLAVWLILVTHPLLDLMTVYGTQLGLPFTDHPFAVGSVFIIDPLYTLPLLAGVIAALALRTPRGLRGNQAGLLLSTLYLAWSVGAQAHVRDLAQAELARQGIRAERLLVTPTPFNTVLWRVLAMSPDGRYHEGFRSLLDREPGIRFDAFAQQRELAGALPGNWELARMQWFSHGFYRLREQTGTLVISDLRMGQEPHYTFNFALAQRTPQGFRAVPVEARPSLPDLRRSLAWLWRRLGGEPVAPPRD